MRSLITGGRGFVGTWLAAHLRDLGDEVAVIDVEVDVTDPVALLAAVHEAGPDAIYHLAAMAHVGDSWKEPLRVLEVNVLGTAALLAAARQGGRDPRILVTSSAEVYGAVTDPAELPLTEASPTAPLTPYAASKLAAEALIGQAVRGYGQQVITVRPFNHIGPGQSPNFAVSALARRIVEADRRGDRAIPVGNLSARRDFTDVRDVVRAYRLLVESGTPGRRLQHLLRVDVAIEDIATAAGRPGGHVTGLRGRPRPCGRSRSPSSGGTRAGSSGPPGGGPRSRWTGRWPTSWHTGASTRATERPGSGREERPAGAGRSSVDRKGGSGPPWPPRPEGGGRIGDGPRGGGQNVAGI